jgi:cell division transport system permease protein
MLGLLSLMLLNARKLSDYFRENVEVQVFMKDEATEGEIIALKKWIELQDYSLEARYITREEAARAWEAEVGEDFVDFLGFNPIPSSIHMRLKADFASSDSLTLIEAELLKKPFVREVEYQKEMIDNIDRNVRRLGSYLTVFSVLLLIIAVALINNTIRLAIYSKRFIIRSMQLVGATRGFIQRPFIWQGISYGILAGMLAFAFIMTVVYFFRDAMPYVKEIQDVWLFVELFVLVFILGILISWISTKLAVRKYIRLRREHLY